MNTSIDELYAYVVRDDVGREFVAITRVASAEGDMLFPFPLVYSDLPSAMLARGVAQFFADRNKRPVTLVKFSRRGDVGTVDPAWPPPPPTDGRN
jgi:hypothetical protein